jgi:hypothetical protein
MAKTPWTSRDRSLEYRRFVMQKLLIEKQFPCFKCKHSHRLLKCEGCITPSQGCDTYRVAISYAQEGIPKVLIKDPQIEPSPTIHMYGTGALCLYFPAEDPWRSSDNIHEKIIPWTAEWLVFYELYLIGGKWLGPAAPHSPDQERTRRCGRAEIANPRIAGLRDRIR